MKPYESGFAGSGNARPIKYFDTIQVCYGKGKTVILVVKKETEKGNNNGDNSADRKLFISAEEHLTTFPLVRHRKSL